MIETRRTLRRLIKRIACLEPHIKALLFEQDDLRGRQLEAKEQLALADSERLLLINTVTLRSGEIIRLQSDITELHLEIESLVHQRDSLESERNQLKGYLNHSVEQLDLANLSRNALKDETEKSRERVGEVTQRIDTLVHEKAVALEELHSLKRFMWAPPGHFYSPIVDPSDIRVLRACEPRSNSDSLAISLSEISLNESAMMDLFYSFADLHRDLNFTGEKRAGNRYYYNNPEFSYADGLTLAGFLRYFRPHRVIEVGSGFSSCLTMDINDRYFERSMSLTFIEPFPEKLLSLLGENDPYRTQIWDEPLQNVEANVFCSLEENDILFIDSSHVSKMASDVNYYLFEIFPRLKKGVIIHLHDIFSSFEYPANWVVGENRSWNEIYILRAFLQFNSAFEVLYFNDLIYKKYQDTVAVQMPLCLKNTGGSIWLRKVR